MATGGRRRDMPYTMMMATAAVAVVEVTGTACQPEGRPVNQVF